MVANRIILISVDFGADNTIVRLDFGLLYPVKISVTTLHRFQIIVELTPTGKDPLLGQSVDDFKHLFDVGLKIHQDDAAALRVDCPIDAKDDTQSFGVDEVNPFQVKHDDIRI